MAERPVIQVWFTGILGTVVAVLGRRWVLFLFLLGLMLVDFVTGWAAALKNHNWESRKAREGVAHKLGSIAVVLVSGAMDLMLCMVFDWFPQIPIQWPALLLPMVIAWYSITELGSILENAVLMGAPVPKWLAKLLKVSADMIDKHLEG